ncbi:PAS domain-containing protein [Hymenobacter sp. 15J16-1T3B]|uniref:PAS domain-containing sensor histidine kinase n=1 Tax=Hymenobacter sp. 15J16-1T3B TaxID=2886941 RepID=UPI001D10DE67|nr:PAS domain-containing protein [Hymenobacter sp. 15J16-1T3B]MCC3156895.1 PAS domain-containing protein [Hymenobacter sp. 15J16-1T3B]
MPDIPPATLASAPADDLLQALLSVSLTGIIVFQPVFGPDDSTIADLAYVHLNPAAQRMLQLPERPAVTFLARYPHAQETGIFAFFCAAFLAGGETRRYDVNYQFDGLDNFFHLQAQRSGALLLVSFTDTADHARTAVEETLRESQAREREALAEAELQRQQLRSVFEQAPAMICIFEGPAHTFQFVNPQYQALVGERPLLGRPIGEAMPELADQPIFDLLDEVYRTGRTFYATEMLVQLDHHNEDRRELEKRYYNFIYQARHNLAGTIDGIFVFAYDVTPQVLARQQVQQLHEEQRILNEQLQAANTELAAAVARAEQAQADTERERNLLQALLMQAPVAIGLFQGPNQVVVAANEQLCAMWGYPAQRVLGRPLLLAVPELQGQNFDYLIAQVAATRVPFVGTELPAQLRRNGQLETRYFDFVYQPLYDPAGEMLGVLDIAIDVTTQVQARQQVQTLNEELAATNEELRVTNEELLTSNTELLLAQLQLQELTQALEGRVELRTREARAARAEAERQRALLERLFMQAPAAICILRGPELVYELVNPGYQQLFPDRQLLGLPIAEALPEIKDHSVYLSFREVFETGRTHQAQGMLIPLARPGDGVLENRYFNYIQQARFDEQGRIDGVMVFAFEVTEQVQARQASEASAQRLQLLTDALPVLISYVDRDERYQFANLAYEAWFKQRPAELMGRQVREVVGEAGYRNVKAYMERVFAGERLSFDARMPYRDDFFRHIHVDYIPDWRHGEVNGFYALVSDVTEQVEAQQHVAAANEQLRATNADLDALNKQLRRTNVDLDNFIYTASHDLKAPITNIEGLLHALTEQLPPEVLQQHLVEPILTRMHGSVERFKRTLDYLTDVSKLQQEHAQPTAPVALAAMIEDVRQDLLPLLRDTDAQLNVDVDACPTILFSPKNLRSVVYNLLSNALKYRHPDRPPVVHISCLPDAGGYLRLSVQDNGLGLDESQRARIFGMFQRLHTHVEGSGIGLYMVKKIVENAGGSIRVESELGQGSTFVVDLPT